MRPCLPDCDALADEQQESRAYGNLLALHAAHLLDPALLLFLELFSVLLLVLTGVMTVNVDVQCTTAMR
jgi:hypothetical protein